MRARGEMRLEAFIPSVDGICCISVPITAAVTSFRRPSEIRDLPSTLSGFSSRRQRNRTLLAAVNSAPVSGFVASAEHDSRRTRRKNKRDGGRENIFIPCVPADTANGRTIATSLARNSYRERNNSDGEGKNEANDWAKRI